MEIPLNCIYFGRVPRAELFAYLFRYNLDCRYKYFKIGYNKNHIWITLVICVYRNNSGLANKMAVLDWNLIDVLQEIKSPFCWGN